MYIHIYIERERYSIYNCTVSGRLPGTSAPSTTASPPSSVAASATGAPTPKANNILCYHNLQHTMI